MSALFAILLLMSSVRPTDPLLQELPVVVTPELGVAFPGEHPQALADIGVGLVRLDASWALREPNYGLYDWTGLDRRMEALRALGIEILLTFDPDSAAYTESSTFQHNRVPLDPDHWQAFVTATVKHYRGLVKYYQGFNEWTNPGPTVGGWPGTLEQLIQFNNLTHDAVKAADPGATFVLGGISSGSIRAIVIGTAPPAKLHWANTAIATSRFDLISGHVYQTADLIHPAAEVLSLYSDRICSTEMGGPAASDYSPDGHFLAAMAFNLERMSSGLEFGLWFRLIEGAGATAENSRTALYDNQGRPKPGAHAFRLLAAVLQDVDHVTGHNPYVIHYQDGSTCQIGWGSGTLEGKQFLRVLNSSKGTYRLESGPVQLGKLPVVEWRPR